MVDWIKFFIINKNKDGLIINELKPYIYLEYNYNYLLEINHYKNNKKNVIYHISSVDMESVYIINNKNNKMHRSYYFIDNNIIRYMENYKNGKKYGIQYEFYPNLKLRNISFYKNGKLHGINYGWSDSGKISIINQYINGKKNGLQFRWWCGELAEIDYYKNNIRELPV